MKWCPLPGIHCVSEPLVREDKGSFNSDRIEYLWSLLQPDHPGWGELSRDAPAHIAAQSFPGDSQQIRQAYRDFGYVFIRIPRAVYGYFQLG